MFLVYSLIMVTLSSWHMQLQYTIATLKLCIDALYVVLSFLSLLLLLPVKVHSSYALGLSLIHGLMHTTWSKFENCELKYIVSNLSSTILSTETFLHNDVLE